MMIAVARLNLNGSERVAVGYGKLEVLAVVANRLYSSDLERVVAELNSDGFEQAVVRLKAGGVTVRSLCLSASRFLEFLRGVVPK